MIPLKDDNPTSKKPIVSYSIIGFCVVIFLAQLGLSQDELRDFTYSYGLIPSVLMGIDQLPDNLNKIYLECDGHWSPEGNLWAAKIISKYVNMN